jgi:Transposase IS4
MARAKVKHGVGGIVSCNAKFLHPSAEIRKKYPNTWQKERIHGLVVVGREHRKIRRKSFPTLALLLTHADFPNIQFNAAQRNCRLETAPASSFSDEEKDPDSTETEDEAAGDEETEEMLRERRLARGMDVVLDSSLPVLSAAHPTVIQRGGSNLLREMDVAALRLDGVDVDDDNDPAPENVPGGIDLDAILAEAVEELLDGATEPTPVAPEGPTWGFSGKCPRRAEGNTKERAILKNMSNTVMANMTLLQMFMTMYPMDYIVKVLIPESNKHLKLGALNESEFFVFLGIILYMSCYDGIQERRLWWSKLPIDMFDGAPFRFNDFMTRNRFEDIMANMRYTDKTPPVFKDPFHPMRQIQDAWNDNMETKFKPSWISVLDESMMEWLNKYTCPAFMCVGHKLHPFGNE